MSLYIAALNSGSNGNCYYIGNDREAILVDAGISCRETEKRMRRLGLPLSLVKAIFISHEHGDHIRGLEVLSKRYQLPVYITGATLQQTGMGLGQVLPFHAHEAVAVGGLQVTAFPKSHDASDPHSFIVSYNNIHIGVLTDIGYACDQVAGYFRQCHAAFLEANYDEQMLEEGRYPYHLKKRIRGGQGHLSNRQALELFMSHRPSFMSHLLLSHLSQDNNRPDLVQKMFEEQAGDVRIAVASRHAETEVYTIRGVGRPLMQPVEATGAAVEAGASASVKAGTSAMVNAAMGSVVKAGMGSETEGVRSTVKVGKKKAADRSLQISLF
jgi:phosphoribosyl 1,2-cyclic phosphodiesterase